MRYKRPVRLRKLGPTSVNWDTLDMWVQFCKPLFDGAALCTSAFLLHFIKLLPGSLYCISSPSLQGISVFTLDAQAWKASTSAHKPDSFWWKQPSLSKDFQEIQNVANVLLIKSSQEMGSVLAVVSIEGLQLNLFSLVVAEGCGKWGRNARETELRSQTDRQAMCFWFLSWDVDVIMISY